MRRGRRAGRAPAEWMVRAALSLLAAVGALSIAGPAAAAAGAAQAPSPAGETATSPAPDAPPPSEAWVADLDVDELGFDGAFRIRVFYAPDYIGFPAAAGHLFLVAADSSRGAEAFFISSDLAFEFGSREVYPVQFEQASDLFGQALGGRLRPGETQLGFVLVPSEAPVGAFLPGNPDSLRIRYANRRASFRRAGPGEIAGWTKRDSAPGARHRPQLLVGLDPGHAGSAAHERGGVPVLRRADVPRSGRDPGQGGNEPRGAPERHPPGGGAAAPRRAGPPAGGSALPTAVRQMGIGGLVVALCYIDAKGEVADAVLLASNTVHLLNLSALSAAMQFRYPAAEGEDGKPTDGWRILPFQFRLEKPPAAAAAAGSGAAGDTAGLGGFRPPQIVRGEKPEYPEHARQKGIAGTVVYRATISPEGKLVEAALEKGVDPLLDQAALTALEHTLFLPASRGGVSVQGEILVPYTFGKPRKR